MIRHLLFILATTFALTSAYAGDFNFTAYRQTSLSDAIAEHRDYSKDDFVIEAGNFKYTVIGTYTGQQRKAVTTTKDLIRHWVKTLGQPKEYESLFDHEVEIESGGKKYWLPIQNPMVQSFSSEVRKGGSVKLYIMLLGASKSRLVFAINEFEGQ